MNNTIRQKLVAAVGIIALAAISLMAGEIHDPTTTMEATNYSSLSMLDLSINQRGGAPIGCCIGSTGNVDNDPADITDITDLTFLVDHLFINLTPIPCPAEANVDGDPGGNVDITDLTFLIDHLFINLTPTFPCQGGPVSYASQVQPILSSRCAISFCHGAGAFGGGYTMGAGAPYATVRNASGFHGAVISGGNASASNLYLKTTITPPFFSRMPLIGGFLTLADQNLIRDWIDQGALDN